MKNHLRYILTGALFVFSLFIPYIEKFFKIENAFILWLLPVFSTLGMMLAVWLSTHIDHKSKVFDIKLILITLLINLLLRSF
jgi:hypothetical protein